MKILSFLVLVVLFLPGNACAPVKRGAVTQNPLEKILAALAKNPIGKSVLNEKDRYELQIIYTQIYRDAQGRPSFQSFWFNVDSTRYFYPASMVKLPLALLSLEKINQLRKNGFPRLTKETPYRLDSLCAFQQAYSSDPSSPDGKPSIAHDIRQILTVSDNLSYNHLFEFLGREYINKSLAAKGFHRTGIVHRFNYPGRDNRYASPITFYEPTVGVYQEVEKFDANLWQNPQHSTLKGKGYVNLSDSLVNEPFEMAKKNWFALTDMEKMLRAVMFPAAVPPQSRFDLKEEDLRFLWHYMGIFPRECDWPKYDSSYHDGYAKFFLCGDTPMQQNGQVRAFNKIGQAYGTLTELAYFVDFEYKVEFLLAATLLCNSDGIFNDDQYDYDTVGLPFLAGLGRETLNFERKRKRKHTPDLRSYREALQDSSAQKK